MRKLKLSQAEIDKLAVVDRVEARRLVYGVASNDACFVIKIAGSNIWQYDLWHSMLKRCLTGKYKLLNKTYEQVVVCDEWLSFGSFLQWCNKEVGYRGKPEGMSLDKDILFKGNKIYSPDTCSFVPHQINSLFCAAGAKRGKHPIGVKEVNGRFVARLKMYGRKAYVGSYDTPEEAFVVYKAAKEAHVKVVALQYKEVLKPSVYDALMSWEVDIFS